MEHASTFQAIRSGRKNPDNTLDYNPLKELTNRVNRYFPEEEFSLDYKPGHTLMDEKIPIRTCLKRFGAVFMARKLEDCGYYVNSEDSFHIPEEFEG